METQEILSVITAAQREAGALLLSAADAAAQEKSGHRDVVTQYDRQVQALLMERLAEALPEATFFCEERAENADPKGACVFIIDPIDGTMNFLKGLRHSCISVAYASGGDVLAGAIYNPYTDELFAAEKGKGACCNGRAIRVSDCPLADALVHFGTSPYNDAATARTFTLARQLYDHSLDVRRRGSAALDLCDAAAGRVGLYYELSLSLWDYAAGMLLVQEAGGVVRQMDGSPLPVDGRKPSIVAGSPRCVDDFFALING